MKRILFLMVSCCLVAGTLVAQNADRKNALSISGNVSNYDGDAGTEYKNFTPNDINPGFGLGLHHYLNRYFNVDVTFNYGSLDYSGNGFSFKSRTFDFLGLLRYKFDNGWILPETSKLSPYLMLGPGVGNARYDYTKGTTISNDVGHLNLAGGLGLKYQLNQNTAIFGQLLAYLPFTDKIDGFAPDGSAMDSYVQSSIGVNFAIGTKKDADGDGVSDKKDQCPSTPEGVAVDANGCALDSDLDGIPDHKDNCPDIAGVDALGGCPDEDNDGITDADDACPEVPGTKALNGCPDSDKDGIADKDDKCPESAAGAKVDDKGCEVDTDGDGILDSQDNCPNVKGVKENKGCPPAPKEDAKDKAATDKPAADKPSADKPKANNTAKPKMTPKQIEEKVEILAKDLRFDIDGIKLFTKPIKSLDELAQIMKDYPNIKLVCEGHTDATASEDYNQRLSEQRAKSVRTYLVKKGVDASRISTKGYGESRPIASNDTPEGRKENRRVDLKLVMGGNN